ncbi:MAG: hypothetical protein HY925_08745, partial [Elusimicrobia bacterium]|nr:hypothetical protein [Elusimicrobiota bacterium]
MRLLARALALTLALSCVSPAVADDDEAVPVQRYLESLRLGDFLREVQIVYPPLREWPSFKEPGGRITKYYVERAYAKHFPWDIDSLRLGFKWGRLVTIQAIYNERFAKEKPLEKIVVDLSLIYGEPSRRGMVYTWRVGKTVL